MGEGSVRRRGSIQVVKERRYCTLVEPIAFTTSLVLSSLFITVQSFYIHRICFYQNGGNPAICTNLTQNHEAEELVEKETARLSIYRLFIEAGPPIFLGLIWGQLNDKLGSKVPLILPMIGFTLYPLGFYIFSKVEGWSPWLLLMTSIPIGFMGGGVAYSVSGFKYIVSISNDENRSFRIGAVEGAAQLGQPIGTLLGSQLYLWGGFDAVFLSAFFLEGVALVAVIFFLKNNTPVPSVHTGHGVFGWNAWKDTVTVLFKKRPERRNVLLLVGISSIRIICMTANWSIQFLYSRLKFQWEQAEYSFYTTVDGIVTAFGVLVMSFLGFKVFKLSPSVLGIIVTALSILGSLVWAFAIKSWMLYLGSGVQFSVGVISIVVRSMLSFIIPGNEIGKALSCVGIIESLMPLLAGPFSNMTYIATLKTFPGAVFLISAFLSTIVLLGFVFLVGARSKPDREEMTAE